jgi:aspartyl-tRNA(Asn)/glutamyl-tRNA(Gln) amidotransferase subunit B
MRAGAEAALPELPAKVRKRFIETFYLSPADAAALSEERSLARYFEEAASLSSDPSATARWMMGPVRSLAHERGLAMDAFPVSTGRLAHLLKMVKEGTLSHSAAQTVFAALADNPEEAPEAAAQRLNLLQQRDEARLRQVVEAVVAAHPGKVKEYRHGKKGLTGFFMGEVMKQAGNLDPKAASALLIEILNRKDMQ